MASSSVVNFSLRQNKSIERGLVVRAVREIIAGTRSRSYTYIGFGSVWFVDFHLVHRDLGVVNLISIEEDPVIAQRARFNRPYRTVQIREGNSYDVLEELYAAPPLQDAWIVWLDYDQAMNDDRLTELERLVEKAPSGSFVLTTFAAGARNYGRPANRETFLENLFDSPVPAHFGPVRDLSDMGLATLLAEMTQQRMVAAAVGAGRPGGAVTFARLAYRDGAPMATAGVALPDPGERSAVRDIAQGPHTAVLERPISTPILTQKEVAALRRKMPSRRLTRAGVQRLGFDLEEDQLESFSDHYLNFPTFEQVWR